MTLIKISPRLQSWEYKVNITQNRFNGLQDTNFKYMEIINSAMSKSKYTFPFGQELKKVEQKDRSPKKVFVLGVYASAVHATWVDSDGKQKVAALAVASEPEIFWRGENAMEIISGISIPSELGKLIVPKNPNMNGPSGKSLDEAILKPLGFTRNDAWLCDLLPESRVNEKQKAAIDKHYTKEIIRYCLPDANIPVFDKKELNNESRSLEILGELETSKAETLVLLGDLPIKHLLNRFDRAYKKLLDFVDIGHGYGKSHEIKINNKHYNVVPLCHPRQASKLGVSNAKWYELHKTWKNSLIDKT